MTWFENGLSPEWIVTCVLSLPDTENDSDYSLQINGFFTEWVLRCFLRWPDWENDSEHSLQINGFSPEWVLRCVLRLADWENDLEHSLQGYVFTSNVLIFIGITGLFIIGSFFKEVYRRTAVNFCIHV